MKVSVLRTGAVMIASAYCMCAMGAEASAQDLDSEELAPSIDEVVVTAQRREQNLQETPLAVSALTSAVIADRQVTSISEVDRFVPNLQWGPATSGAASTASLSIRGIGQVDAIPTADPGVAMHLDGVYLGRVTGSALDLVDIERIEVLRGPQGTLFGRNTAGGAVNIITAKPTGQFGGKLDVTGGVYTRASEGKYQGKLSLDVPATETVAAKLNVLGKSSEGWGRNAAPGRGEGMAKDDDVAARLALLIKPTENFDLYLTADHSKRNGTVMPHAALLGPQAVSDDDPRHGRLSAITADDVEVTGLSMTADLSWNDVSFRSISGYRKQRGDSGQDFDGSDLILADQSVSFEQDQFTQEFHAVGSAFKARLDWLLGLFYFTEEARSDSAFTTPFVSIRNVTGNGSESEAIFGNATLHLFEALRLTGGLRYTDENKDIHILEASVGPFAAVPPGSRASARFSDVSHKIALEYQVTDDLMTYVSWSQGFRSGGFNGRPTSPQDLLPYDEETNDSYEAGLKSDWLNHRLRLNLAAFLSEYKGIQLITITETPGGGIAATTDNAGNADIKGVEVEIDYAASEQLKIFAAVGVQDVRHVIEPRPGFVLDPSTVSDSLPQATEVNSALGFTYLLPWNRYESRLGGEWTYRSSYFHQIDNARLPMEDGYHLFNAHFYIKPSDHWHVTVYGKNLTDEVYRAYGVASAPLNLATVWYAPTREVGATVSFSF